MHYYQYTQREYLQNAIATEAVYRFTELVRHGPDEAVAAGIDKLAQQCEELLTRLAPQQPIVLVFLTKAFAVFHRLALGRTAGLQDIAAEADAMTAGGTDLASLVDALS